MIFICNDVVLLPFQVKREPEGSTARYTRWINSINCDQLYTQIYTSNGPTVVMPTWFCHRKVFENVGGFSEDGKGVPEDYIFFLHHLRTGGKLIRVDKVLIMYRYVLIILWHGLTVVSRFPHVQFLY